MKKIFFFLMVATLSCGNVYSQAKKPTVKRTSTSISAKQKAEAEAKAKAEAEAAENARRIAENNSKCRFSLDTGFFVSQQGYDDYVIYEIPEMTASELKSAVYTTLTSMFNSPKDAITNVSDNIIQIEGYSPSLFEDETSMHSKIFNHISFGLVIQFKDGKIRYNSPSLKRYQMKVENSDIQEQSNISGANMRRYLSGDKDVDGRLKIIADYFNNIIASINSKAKKSNDW